MIVTCSKKLLLSICFFLAAVGIQAQNFTIKNFPFPKYVSAGIIEASDSTIWVGTDKGAARFNGFSWEFFNETNGLNIDSVRYIATDAQQSTWFIGNSGVAILRNNSWEKGTGLLFDKTGSDFWVNGDSLLKISSTDTVSYPNPVNDYIFAIEKNGKQELSYDYMASSFQNTYYLKEDRIWIDTTWVYINDFHIDAEDNKWVVDGGQIFMRRFNSGLYRKIECPLVSEQHFNSVTSDRQGNMYFGTWNTGLFIKTKDTWYHLNSSNGLLGDNVSDVDVDENENVWVSTTNYGLGLSTTGVSVIEKDGWINPTNGLSGVLYWDVNNNGQQDDDEPGIPNQFVEIGSNGAFAISNADGVFLFKPVVGENTITAVLKDFWEQGATPISFIFVYPGNNLPSFKIGLKWKVVNDVGVSLSGNGLRPGFDSRLYLTLRNEGSVNASTALTLDYDPILNLLETSISPTFSEDGHLKWEVNDIKPLHSQTILVTFNLPPSVPLGTVIKNEASVSALDGETDMSDNVDSLKTIVTGSLDPNDKLVAEGIFEEGYVEMNSKLTYTIRFQNTGTDTAFVVKIKDEIDPHLDITSLHILASSHEIVYSLDNRHLNFSFPNIRLPDRIRNEPVSHGYVKYSIAPLNTILNNTVVYNSASIYFDFNEPVVTNIVQNKFVNELPEESVLGAEDWSSARSIVYPNPTKSILNVSHEVLAQYLSAELISSTGLFLRRFDLRTTRGKMIVEDFPTGLYFLRFSDGNNILVTKIVIGWSD